MLFEHIFFNYIFIRSTDTIPAEIHVEPFSNPMTGRQEAKITLRIRRDLPRATPEREGEFEEQTECISL